MHYVDAPKVDLTGTGLRCKWSKQNICGQNLNDATIPTPERLPTQVVVRGYARIGDENGIRSGVEQLPHIVLTIPTDAVQLILLSRPWMPCLR